MIGRGGPYRACSLAGTIAGKLMLPG